MTEHEQDQRKPPPPGASSPEDILNEDPASSEVPPAATAAAPSAAAPSAAAAVSSSAASTDDDLTIAQALQAVESLTSLYGFSYEASSAAVEALGAVYAKASHADLVQACCDYVLDSGLGVDAGGAIAPIDPNDCPHVADAGILASETGTSCVVVTARDVPATVFDLPCCFLHEAKDKQPKAKTGGFKDDLEYDPDASVSTNRQPTCPKGENWWCLRCGGVYCSRYVNGHGVQHYEEHKDNDDAHCVMVGLADLSVWCHGCGAYLQTHTHPRLASILQKLQDVKFPEDRVGAAAATQTSAS